MSSADENRGLLAGESLQQACFLPFSLWKTPQLHYGVLDCPDMCTVLLPQEGSLRTEKGRLEDIYIQPRTQLIKLASSLMWDFLIYSFTHLFFRKVYWVPSTQQALIQALEISIEWNSRVNEKKKRICRFWPHFPEFDTLWSSSGLVHVSRAGRSNCVSSSPNLSTKIEKHGYAFFCVIKV